MSNLMTIHIEELTLSSIIGILDFERISPQKIVINMKINYLYQSKNFINYADVIQIIENLIKTRKYELLEEALEEIPREIKVTYPQIKSLFLKISKPNIIKNATVSLSITLN